MARAVVDSSAWSLFLRRRAPDRLSQRETGLRDAVVAAVARDEAVLLGVVRQELLGGVTPCDRFTAFRDRLRAFDDEPVTTMDHERAAEMFNACRAAGVQGSVVDFLVCAVAERLAAPIYTLDGDFERYHDILGVDLYP